MSSMLQDYLNSTKLKFNISDITVTDSMLLRAHRMVPAEEEQTPRFPDLLSMDYPLWDGKELTSLCENLTILNT